MVLRCGCAHQAASLHGDGRARAVRRVVRELPAELGAPFTEQYAVTLIGGPVRVSGCRLTLLLSQEHT